MSFKISVILANGLSNTISYTNVDYNTAIEDAISKTKEVYQRYIYGQQVEIENINIKLVA